MSKLRLLHGDALHRLADLEAASVQLIVTSPPYADQGKGCYAGVAPDAYVEWFLPIAQRLFRVLRDDGSFILNIKERVVGGERHTYVLELIQALRQQGWRWTEEFVWHKKNSYPGKWPTRFRDAWERLLQFNKTPKFAMYQEAVMVPVGTWAQRRLKNLSETDHRRDRSRAGSNFGKRVANWVGRDKAYPSNVLHLATECANRGHGAAFPESLPAWFIKLFSRPGDWVLDPFMGAGTVPRVALRLERNAVGIELEPDYFAAVAAELQHESARYPLFDPPARMEWPEIAPTR
jgi:DNA modification methylase